MKLEEIKIEDIKSGKIFRATHDNEEIEPLPSNYRIKENSGYYLISGEIELRNKLRYPAIFGISSDDGGEIFEYYIFVGEDKKPVSHRDDLEKVLKIDRKEIFPFKYHLSKKVEGDIYLDDQY